MAQKGVKKGPFLHRFRPFLDPLPFKSNRNRPYAPNPTFWDETGYPPKRPLFWVLGHFRGHFGPPDWVIWCRFTVKMAQILDIGLAGAQNHPFLGHLVPFYGQNDQYSGHPGNGQGSFWLGLETRDLRPFLAQKGHFIVSIKGSMLSY